MCKSRILFALLALLAAAAPSRADSVTEAAKTAEVTVPLSEVRRMDERIRELEGQREREKAPPLPAAVQRFELDGRLLEDGVDLTAHVAIQVLAGEKWVRVPLLRRSPQTELGSLPEVENAAFAVVGDQLTFLTHKPGTYEFDLSLLQRAERSANGRSAELELPEAGLARARIAYDAGLFRLLAGDARGGPEGTVIFPQANHLKLAWQVRGPAAELAQKPAQKPELEPFIALAHASSVSTLEGRVVTRVRYELRFAGKKSLAFEIPSGVTVDRVYRNGSTVPFKLAGEHLAVQVEPLRAGDEAGSLELVLSRAMGQFHLSGNLEWKLPSVSWPVHELFLDLHLPTVFAYRWRGGSLSPVDDEPDKEDFSYRIPLPGQRLSFHQYLLTGSAPDVQLDYAVALEGQYFRN
jgi:hypothetical protein